LLVKSAKALIPTVNECCTLLKLLINFKFDLKIVYRPKNESVVYFFVVASDELREFLLDLLFRQLQGEDDGETDERNK